LPVAVEDPNTLIALTLHSLRFDVRAVHCVALARYRLRIEPSRSKSDGGDAFALANIVRVEPLTHRPLPSPSDECVALRVITRAYRDASREKTRTEHQIWMHLQRYYPVAALPGLSRRELRTALRLAPTPAAARRLGERTLTDALIQAGRQRGARQCAHDLLANLRRPVMRQPELIEESYGWALLTMLDRLELHIDTRNALERLALDMASKHPLWPVYSSFPALGRIVGATLLSEIGDDPMRFRNGRGLASMAGCAPVTFASGERTSVRRRNVYNRRLFEAVRAWGLPLIQHSPEARAIYDVAHERGDRYPGASRRTLNRYLRSLYVCATTGALYDPSYMRRVADASVSEVCVPIAVPSEGPAPVQTLAL
jgi:transposase